MSTSRTTSAGNDAGLDAEAYRSILAALPLAIYGLRNDLTVVFNNGQHLLRDFLVEGPSETPAPTHLIGSDLMEHVPVSEREPLRRLAEQVLGGAGQSQGLAGVDFLHASAAGLQRLRVLATGMPDSPGGVDLVLTCFENPIESAQAGEAPAGSSRLDVARQLAATLNHEINNPLFIVSATLEDLLSEEEEPSAHRRLKAALDCVWRVASAVKQLQDIRQVVTTAYIEGLPMVDLDASAEQAGGQ